MINAVDTVETMQEELERAAETGHYLSEYNNGIVVFKPNATWDMVRNRVTRRRYVRVAGAGLRVIGRRVGFKNNVQVI